jgi:outer membrane immunogenic protein
MKSFKAAVALILLSGVSSVAADLPSRKAEPVAPPPAPLWKGFYVGLNAGGTWGNNNPVNVSTYPAGTYANSSAVYWAMGNTTVNSNLSNANGFIGGGQIGYNWQPTYGGYSFVTGAEADIQGIAGVSNGNRNGYLVGPGAAANETVSNFSSTSASMQFLGTVRGRVGWLVTPTLLIYGTGGLAYGGVSFNRSTTSIETAAGVNQWIALGNATYSNTQVGWTAGGGLEWMFMPNWSAKAEYLYYDLGNISATSVSTISPLVTSNTLSTAQLFRSSTISGRINGNLIRAGVNYHFNLASAPVVAKF